VCSQVQSSTSRRWVPILLICPPSVISNWINEFKSWGHFAVETFQGNDRAVALNRVKIGQSEVLLCGKSLFSKESCFSLLKSVQWKLVVVDEYHEFKGKKTSAWDCLYQLTAHCACQIIGLTGTAMQNDYEELWNLVYLVQPGLLGSWAEFRQNYVQPLKLARYVK